MNPQPISTLTAEHYRWGQASDCDGWHLMHRADLSVIQERVPPGRGEVRHYHTLARQFFYILYGVGTMLIGAERLTLKASEGLEVPPHVAHEFRNDSETEVVFLVISAPTTRGDRVNVDP